MSSHSGISGNKGSKLQCRLVSHGEETNETIRKCRRENTVHFMSDDAPRV